MPIKNEKDVKARVKKLLDAAGYFWFMPPSNGYGRSGISDFIALKNGVFMAIETKFGSNKPTAMQKGFLNSVIAEQALAFVVNETNLDWFETFLEDFGKERDMVASERKMSNDGGARLMEAMRALQALI